MQSFTACSLPPNSAPILVMCDKFCLSISLGPMKSNLKADSATQIPGTDFSLIYVPYASYKELQKQDQHDKNHGQLACFAHTAQGGMPHSRASPTVLDCQGLTGMRFKLKDGELEIQGGLK